MRYPKFLPPNGRIGFIAPSFGAVIEPYKTLFERAVKKFSSMGYEIIKGQNCYESLGIGKSNSAKKCAEEINQYFIEDLSDVLISVGGGETMCEDLPFVDFEKIAKSKPKWFMGYSDNTNLTFTLPTLCDTAAIYGPCASSFGQVPWHMAVLDAYKLLTGEKLEANSYDFWELYEYEDPYKGYNADQPSALKFVNYNRSFSGRLLGGCLDVIICHCGTKFDKVKEFNKRYEKDGVIWFLESCELSPMDDLRALWQLENAGWFENAKGFIIGRPLGFLDESYGLNHNQAVLKILEKYEKPIILNADIGHLPPAMPLISGAMAEITAYFENDKPKLSVKQKLE